MAAVSEALRQPPAPIERIMEPAGPRHIKEGRDGWLRVIIPVRDKLGRVIGVYGRDVTGTANQKYLYTAETGAFWTNQFQNDDMIAGYRSLGEELLRQLPGPPAIDALYGYIGTAGCFLGTTRALREVLPARNLCIFCRSEAA